MRPEQKQDDAELKEIKKKEYNYLDDSPRCLVHSWSIETAYKD